MLRHFVKSRTTTAVNQVSQSRKKKLKKINIELLDPKCEIGCVCLCVFLYVYILGPYLRTYYPMQGSHPDHIQMNIWDARYLCGISNMQGKCLTSIVSLQPLKLYLPHLKIFKIHLECQPNIFLIYMKAVG